MGFFYREFGIAILKFADLSDFLLASILEPLSVVIFVSWVVFYFLAFKGDHSLRRRYPGYGRFVDKTLKSKYSDPIVFTFSIVFFTIFFLESFAVGNAEEIKSGEEDTYVILVPDAKGEEVEQQVALIGSSSRFSYFYDKETNEAKVIPVESISYMRKLLAEESKAKLNESDKSSQ